MENSIKRIKTIGIDARLYGPVSKGLGRYIKEVLDRVLNMDKYNSYVVFLSPESYKAFSSGNPKVKKVLVRARWYSLQEQIVMPFLIWREKIDLMHVPHFNAPFFCPAKFVVTIHDLILTKFPSQRASTLSPLLYKIKDYFYRLIIKKALSSSEKIISVSEFTKQDIIEQFKINPDKIIVTYEAVSRAIEDKDKKDDKEIILGYNIDTPYLLYVGNAYPHKNLEALIRNFSVLKEEKPNISLVLVGKEDYFYKRLKTFVKQKKISKIIFCGFIPDDKLGAIYRQALAYVFPSRYEGFGLPPLEAMTHDCPVLSSNQASMPEILGSAALYFNPANKEEMISKLKMLIDDKDLRDKLIIQGREQIKLYSWRKCAEQTMSVYKAIMN